MARGATATTTPGGDDSSKPSEPRASKRRCVPSACVPCRKRKSKCDGGTPKCATCTAVYKTDCHYDEGSEARRGKATAQKRDIATARGSNISTSSSSTRDHDHSADFLVRAIRSLPESEAAELVQMLRKDTHQDMATIADAWRRTAAMPFTPAGEQASLEGDLALLMGKPAVTQTGVSRHFGHTSSLGLVPEDENYSVSRPIIASRLEHTAGTWTTVTQDLRFIEHLLALYFQWPHPFYVVCSSEAFYKDFRSGRQKYCSSLLVNAILAYACHFTDEPTGRTDPDDPRTAGDHFFAEARRLLYEDESPSLTTTQALCIMGLREPSAGRDSSGFMYMGRCMRMAIELGMHLDITKAPELDLSPSEIEVRKVTFWGCFVVDTVWTICIGRISQLPRSAITVEKPTIEESSFPGAGFHAYAPPPPVLNRIFLQEFASLAELINDNNFMFYAPKERFTSRRLLGQWEKYKSWYKNLPAVLRIPDRPAEQADSGHSPLPHFIVLHMLYYTVIVHLFRPMLKVELIGSDVRPRDICIDGANQASELLRLYRKHYDLRAGHLVMTHILLSVCIVHLLYSERPQNNTYLIEGLKALEDLSVCHHFGARSFKIIHNLAKTWNLPWPESLKLSKLVPKEDATIGAGPIFHIKKDPTTQEAAGNGYSHGAPPSVPSRRESLSMFSSAQSPPGPSMPPSSMQGIHSTLPYHSHHQGLNQGSGGLVYSSPSAPNPAHQAAHENLFWTPIPNVGVPIFPREFASGPMDLNNMLENTDQWDRFGRDGFKISEAWQMHDPSYVCSGLGTETNVSGGEEYGVAPAGHAGQALQGATGPTNTSNYPSMSELAPSGLGFESSWWSGGGREGGGTNRGVGPD